MCSCWTDGRDTVLVAVPIPVPPVFVSVYAENVKLWFCRQRQVAAGAVSLLTQDNTALDLEEADTWDPPSLLGRPVPPAPNWEFPSSGGISEP